MSEGGDNNDAVSLSPGQRLAEARAASKLSVADVARQLKLTVAQVTAIEAGAYEQLPGRVFVRGFVRNYARLLGLDPEALLAQIAERPPQPPRHEAKSSPVEIPLPTGRETRWHRYAIAVAALVIPAAIYELSSDDGPQVVVKPRETAPAEAPQVAAALPESGARPESARAQPEPKAEAAVSAVSPPGTQHVVKLKFDEEAWAEVRDASGRRILYRLNPAGSEQAVTGTPPLLLIVGKAKSVRVTVNDEPVDLAPHTKTDVARLTLE